MCGNIHTTYNNNTLRFLVQLLLPRHTIIIYTQEQEQLDGRKQRLAQQQEQLAELESQAEVTFSSAPFGVVPDTNRHHPHISSLTHHVYSFKFESFTSTRGSNVISYLQAGSSSLGTLEEQYEGMEQKIKQVRWQTFLSVVRIDFSSLALTQQQLCTANIQINATKDERVAKIDELRQKVNRMKKRGPCRLRGRHSICVVSGGHLHLEKCNFLLHSRSSS